ncbi:MAG TPA: hypothetical protein VEW42_01725 [Candidatus Eisenbacteria bacterium]|nr:hypothetical protein [Candidatus Eisenbacteria bacterium]
MRGIEDRFFKTPEARRYASLLRAGFAGARGENDLPNATDIDQALVDAVRAAGGNSALVRDFAGRVTAEAANAHISASRTQGREPFSRHETRSRFGNFRRLLKPPHA